MNNNYLSNYILEMSQLVGELDEILKLVSIEIKRKLLVRKPIHYVILKDMIDDGEISLIPRWAGVNQKNYNGALDILNEILYTRYKFVGPVLHATIIYWIKSPLEMKNIRIYSGRPDDLDIIMTIKSNEKVKYKQMEISNEE